MEGGSQGDSQGDWTVVNRRRGGSTYGGHSLTLNHSQVNTYTPFKPLYSTVASSQPPLKSLPSPPRTQPILIPKPNRQTTTMTTPSPPGSPPPANATYYFSPHSPTQLRFPPSSHFTEWRGRCFRCCRTGHNSALCRNPMRCGKCWGEGHMGTRCKSNVLNPAAMPYWSNRTRQPTKPVTTSPIDELLLKPCPMAAPALPSNRPKRLSACIERDSEIAAEIAKLGSSVIFDTHGHELGFKLDDIAGFATRTKVVATNEISIGMLSPGKFLITLPSGMAPETFINATTPELWDAGFTFQPWSPLEGARLVVPEYKALLTLEGLPPFLRKEPILAKAVAGIGTFLGTVPQQGTPDLSLWTLAVAVDRLERIPDELAVYEMGIEFILKVHTKNWIRSPLYTAAQLPKLPPKYSKPFRQPNPRAPVEEEVFYCSRRVILDLCKDLDPDSLPEEVRAIMVRPPGRAEITFGQAELVANLPRTRSDAGTISSPANFGVAGQDTTQFKDHSQETTHTMPHTILPQVGGEPILFEEAGRLLQGESAEGASHTDTGPQEIIQPVRILKRSFPENETTVPAPGPRKISQTNAGGQARTNSRQQTKGGDKGEPSGLNQVTAGVRDKQGIAAKAQQRPKKGKAPQQPKFGRVVNLQIPLRPPSFKHARARPKNKSIKGPTDRAQVSLSADGFYEVAVQYDHCDGIAEGCGLQAGDVKRALAKDNE